MYRHIVLWGYGFSPGSNHSSHYVYTFHGYDALTNNSLTLHDVIMNAIASEITSRRFVNSTVYSGADRGKHESSASLAFVRGIHRGPVDSTHKWPVTRKMFPFDDVIIYPWELHPEFCAKRLAILWPSLRWRHNRRDGVSNHQPHDIYSTVYSDGDQRNHQSSASLAFVRGIHRGPVNYPHKWPVTRKMSPCDDVIMIMINWM